MGFEPMRPTGAAGRSPWTPVSSPPPWSARAPRQIIDNQTVEINVYAGVLTGLASVDMPLTACIVSLKYLGTLNMLT